MFIPGRAAQIGRPTFQSLIRGAAGHALSRGIYPILSITSLPQSLPSPSPEAKIGRMSNRSEYLWRRRGPWVRFVILRTGKRPWVRFVILRSGRGPWVRFAILGPWNLHALWALAQMECVRLVNCAKKKEFLLRQEGNIRGPSALSATFI